MTEQSAMGTIRDKAAALYGARLHWQRFEDKLSAGIPDSNLCITGIEWWVEGKHVDALPKRHSTPIKIGLKKEQHLWLTAGARVGRNVGVVARGPWGWIWFNDHFELLHRGVPWEQFRHLGLIQKRLDLQAGLEHLYRGDRDRLN